MTDESTIDSDEAAAAETDSAPLPVWRRLSPKYRLPQRFRRHSGRLVITGVALVAAFLVSFVTIDLGPFAIARAEQALSAQLDRTVHIGRLGTYIFPGRFLIEDLVIDGLSPEHEPFFTTDRIVISTSWVALLRGEILVDSVDMGPWRMVAESFPDGRQSFPRFVAQSPAKPEPLDAASTGSGELPGGEEVDEAEGGWPFVTTVQHLLAHDGEFVYRDHNAPWSVVARNIDLTIAKGDSYEGDVSLSGGTVEIGAFEPMTTDMEATYELDGLGVTLTHIDLSMDGFHSALTGQVELANWPEQTYQILESDIDLPTMKEIFFRGDSFSVDGEAQFTGSWHIYDGGRDLTGVFQSADWKLNGLAFPDTTGSVIWTADRFDVLDYASKFYGGDVELDYSMAPLGSDTPGIATLDTQLTDVELSPLFEELGVRGVRPEGYVTGPNILRWPLARFADLMGEGHLTVRPPDGTAALMTRSRRTPSSLGARRYAAVPFRADEGAEPWHFPIGGDLTYTVGPEWIEIAPSQIATPSTLVEFEGRTAFGDRSEIPFNVSSIDWQESDRLMASFMTAFGKPTGEIAVGGRGQLNGVMLGEFVRPRIEATFDGDAVQAWNVAWGRGRGRIVVEDAYLEVIDGRFDDGSSEMRVDGRFALDSPRIDGNEEINARFALSSLPAQRLRDAFALEGYPIDGGLTGEIRLYGNYGRPFGFGSLTLDEPVAWGEPFDSAEAGLRFEGDGVRLDALEVGKGTGRLTGAMFVRWNGTYSFNVDGRDIPVGSLQSLGNDTMPLGGLATFVATGAGDFDDPRYEVRGAVTDLSLDEEVLGQMSGRLDVRDGVMGVEVEVGSPGLAMSGSGRVELSPGNDADLLLRFTNTTLDPYVRLYAAAVPSGMSAVASGTLEVTGPLRDLDRLLIDATVEQLDLGVFDYMVANEGTVQLSLDQGVIHVRRMNLVGDGTELALRGQVGIVDEQVVLRADGRANVGFLRGFFPDLRSSGSAQLAAEIGGTFRQPVVVGSATMDGVRVRHLSFPHGLDNLEGQIVFEPDGLHFDDLTGELAGGPVRFGGRVGVRGFDVGDLNVTAAATSMNFRFPEGIRSVVDAELTLGGELDDMVLSGMVEVQDAVWLELFEPSTGLLNLAPDTAALVPRSVESVLPLSLDIRIVAPSSLRISDNTARIVSSADLTLGGTYDQPLLLGNADIERGEVFFEGNRYRVTQGSIAFANPLAIDPFFDVQAETDIRVPGQTYRVTIDVSGTMDRLEPELSSDPPLQEMEILSLLLGDLRDPQAAEIRALRAQEASRQELLQAGAARLLTSPISSNVGRLVEESFGVDSFEITPSLDRATQQSTQLSPTARLLIGKRISDRAHLTFSRAVSGANQDLLVVLEYDQNDRLSWILSQNENKTYALDFRVRHSF